MLWVLSVTILLISAVAGMAQTVQIRSGEHDRFTRMVVYTPSPGNWQFGRVKGGYELRLQVETTQFDLSRAFDLIPRTRVSELSDIGAGALFFKVDCECHANAFVTGGGQIVVDVMSGPNPVEGSKFEAYLDQPASPRTKAMGASKMARLGLPLLPVRDSATGPQLVSEAPPSSGGKNENDGSAFTQPDKVAPTPTEKSEADRVRQTELALVEQLGRAAAQGLVDANLSTLEAEVQRVTQPLSEQKTQLNAPEPEAEPLPSLNANDHIAIQTSIDREANARKSEVLSTQEGKSCLPDAEYEIESWGEDLKGGADVSKFKAAILGEFDLPNADALNAYIRHQIYLTFGAEARAVATQFKDAVHRPEIVRQMAEIVDWHSASNYRDFSPQMGCDGKTALWAALAQPEFRTGQEINKKAIISSFSNLPLHLRRHLGPRLAQKFLSFEDMDTAIALRNLMDRAEGNPGAGFGLLEARIDLEQGDHQGAEKILTEIVNEDTELSPSAALEYVESKLAQGEAVPERMREIISTYAFEQREMPLGADLKITEIQAFAAASDFQTAYDELERAASNGLITRDDEEFLREDVLRHLLNNGSDAQFLKYTVGGKRVPSAPASALRTSLAGRLLKLGFLQDARQMLNVEGAVPDIEQRIIYAQIALGERKPDVALGYLAGLKGNDAAQLQARALAQTDRFDAAAEVYRDLGENERQSLAEMRAGAWGELSKHGSGALREMGQIITTDFVPENVGPLAQNDGLLEQSQYMREVIGNLLEGLPTP